jgi:molecular chaperone GrpE
MADEQPHDVADFAGDAATEATAATEPQAINTANTATTDATARIAELERQVAELQQQVERERDQATEYMRHWHTAQADFSNYKRRAQQEQAQRERLLTAQALAPTLNALDSLERAFIALPTTLRSYTWIEGIALVELQLRRALELQDIRAVEAEPGQSFDPTRHEPIGEVETAEHAEGAIAVVAQRGYESQGLLIRPALVQLARKPAPAHQSHASDASHDDVASADDATEATSRT